MNLRCAYVRLRCVTVQGATIPRKFVCDSPPALTLNLNQKDDHRSLSNLVPRHSFFFSLGSSLILFNVTYLPIHIPLYSCESGKIQKMPRL